MENQQNQNIGTTTGSGSTQTSDFPMPTSGANRARGMSRTARFSIRSFIRPAIIAVVALLVIGGGAYGFKLQSDRQSGAVNSEQLSDNFDVQDIPLKDFVNSGSLGLNTVQSLSINGQLRANNSLVIAPTARPEQGTIGQVYFDKAGNVLAYYNGTQFIDIAGSDDVSELRTQLETVRSSIPQVPAALTLPQGIATQPGNNTFTGSNTFTGNLSAASVALSGAALLQSTLTVNGAANLASVSASSLSVTGATSLGAATASSLLLSSALPVGSGGTGTTSLASNGVIIGQGSGALTSVTAAGAGLCLVSTAGAPSFQACPGGGGSSVDSLNGLSGALTINNASGAGLAITIDDASTAAKGIASFNATNFSVSSGTVNTIQDISVNSAPTFNGLTLTANLSIGANSIVTSGATISAAELDVLDSGIDESEVTGVITDVTAGSGLTGGAASGNATLNIASANAAIAINADNIALTLQPAGDGLSSTTSSGSGFEILGGGLSLLQGCNDGQILKWNETTDMWSCSDDAGASGLGDNISVGGTSVTDANFVNTVVSGTTAGITWGLNTTPSPDEIALTVSNASATDAGVVTTGIQSFAGDKTFNSAVTVSGLFSANGGLTVQAGDTFTLNGDNFTDLTGDGLSVAGGILQTALGVAIDSSEITDLTITGADIADNTIALGTKTTGDYSIGNTAGTGIAVTGTSGEAWSPTISLSYAADLTTNTLGVNQSSFAATGVLFEGSVMDGFETLLQVANPTADNTITLPNGSGVICLVELGNCAGSGTGVTSASGGSTNRLAKFTSGQNIENSTITDDGTNVTSTGNLIIQGGNVTAGTNSQLGSFILTDGNGQSTTLRAGDSATSLTFILPTAAGSAYQCLKYDTGGQLIWDDCDGGGGGGGGVTALNGLSGSVSIQGNSQIGVTPSSPNINLSINADSIGDSQLAFNTGQNLTTASAPSFAGLTLTGNLSVGTNSIVTSGATISSVELEVLDNGIDESEVTGVITDVTAGTGLTGGAASGNATVNVASANGGIVVAADSIALTLQPSGNGLSATTSSGSGLEILSSGLTLLQGCSDGEILKWNETTDVWSCASDAGGAGLGDDISVNSANASNANFIDTVASGTTAGVVWALNTTPSPDEISLTVSNASATLAGVVTTGVQSFAGDKTFGSALNVTGLFTASGGVTIETGDTLTFNGDAFTDLTGTGLTISAGVLQSTLGVAIDSSEITDLTIVGADIANNTITDTELAFNTGQNLTVSSTPSFAGITLTGNLSIGTNSIVTGATTITSTELDVLDGGIAEGEVTGVITDVTAGTGLTGGAASGNATLNVASANGGIVVNANDIALTLQGSGNGLSSTTSSGSGLEILAGGFALLQGCSDTQVLKWNETTDVWECSDDAGGSGLGDDVYVGGTTVNGANFIDTVASGTTAGVAWALNTTPTPDEISLTVSNASATVAGVVTTGVQSFAGAKTFGGQIVANGGINLGAQTLQGTASIIDFTNFDVLANGNTTIGGTLTVTSSATFNSSINIGLNSIVTSGATISSVELDVLDNGIDESEVTGVITDVIAGSGLTGGNAAGSATVNIASANGGIVVNNDNIALTLQPAGDGLSSTTSSGSGLEILSGGFALLQGCATGQVLKWNESTDVWECSDDAGGSGLGDDVFVNGSAAGNANFVNTTVSGTSAGVTWALNTTPTPDEISITISNASATDAGVVTTGAQSFAGVKTFGGQIVANGGVNLGTQTLQGTTSTIDFTNFDVLANGNTTVGGTLTVSGTSTLNGSVTVAASQFLTLTGSGTRPGSPTPGMLYYDTSTNQLIQWNGTKWVSDRSNSTKIIAPSNASQAVRDAADVVLTGTADQTLINTALTTAAGGKVYIAEGTVTITGSISVPNNTTLAGAGAGTLITIPNSHNTSIDAITNTTGGGSGTNVTIQDLRLEGNDTNQTSGNMYGIHLNGIGSGTGAAAVRGAKVMNVAVNNWESNGIYVVSSSNNTVTNNTVQGNTAIGIQISSSNNTVTNNTVQGNGQHGIYVNSSGDTTVTNNTVQGNTGSGIYVYSSVDTTVTNNTVQGNTGSGIYLWTTNDNTVTSNTIAGNLGSGIFLDSNASSNAISANRIHNSGGAGGNNGIYLFESDLNTINSNTISDSSCGTGTLSCYGINISDSDSDNNYLADNYLTDTDGDATTTVNNSGTGTIFGGQNNGTSYLIQPADDFTITGTAASTISTSAGNLTLQGGSGTVSLGSSTLLTASGALNITSGGANALGLDAGGAAAINIGGTSATSIVMGRAGGGTIRVGQNGGTVQIDGTNFDVSTVGVVTLAGAQTKDITTSGTNALTIDTGGAASLAVGTASANAVSISRTGITTTINGALTVTQASQFNGSVTVAASQSLTLTGSGSRPGSPTPGMLYFDTSTNQLIQWNGTKWVSDRSDITRIIAPSGASQAIRDAADVVLTGTADQTLINTALTAAAGGKVYIAEGTVSITGSISIPNNTTLAGAGYGTLITIPNTQNGSYSAITNTTTGGNGTGITIQDLRLDGNDNNQTSGNMNGIGLNGMGSGTGASAIQGARISNVHSNNWEGTSTGSGISLSSSSNNVITDSSTMGNTSTGIYIASSSSSNTITGNTAQGNGSDGITVDGSGYNTITGNTTQGNVSNGIQLRSSSFNTTVTGNTAQGNGSYGFMVFASSSNTITGNSSTSNIAGVYLTGASASNNTVSGNAIGSNTSWGIHLTSSASSNTITGNRINSSGGSTANNGIYLDAADFNSITNNDITDGQCTTTCHAINIFNSTSDQNSLSDNRHTGSAANTSSINDAGTGTIYANQLDASGNLINKSQGGGFTVGAGSAAASFSLQGGFVSTQLPAPALSATVTNVGTAGATTYRYQVTAIDGTGETTGSTVQQTTTGNATLSGANYNTITWTPVGGAYQYKIYRCTGAACTPLGLATIAGNNTSYNDTAAGSPSGAVPGANTTGGASLAGSVAISTGSLSTAGTVRLDNGGALQNITGYTQSTGTLSFSGGGNFSVDSAGVDITTGGAVSGVTGLTMASGNFLQNGSGTFTTGTGIVTLNGSVDVANTAAFSTKVGATFVTAGTLANDISLGTGSFYLLDTSGAAQVFNSIAAGRDGQYLTLTNVDASNTVTLVNNGTGTNKIITGTGTNVTIPIGGSVTMIFDSANARWRVVGADAASLQSAYNNSATPALMTLSDAKNFEVQAADTATDPSIVMRLMCTSCATGATGNFLIQNSSSAALLSVAGNGSIYVGTANNGISLTGSGGSTTGAFTLQGTARNQKKIRLTAEYAGAVLDNNDTGGANCSTNFNGTMTSGLDLTNRMNYFKWTTTAGSNQCYNVVVQVPVPTDFDGWSTGPLFSTYVDNTTNRIVNVEVRDTAGTVESGCNYANVTHGSAGAWGTTNSSNCTIAGTYTAGEYMTIRIRMTAPNGGDTRVGNIVLTYNSKF